METYCLVVAALEDNIAERANLRATLAEVRPARRRASACA
jgi:hypothetical protein